MQADLDGSLLDLLDEHLLAGSPAAPARPGGPPRRRPPPNPETWGRTADARRGLSATLAQVPEAEVTEP